MSTPTHADTQMPLRIAHVEDVAEGIRSFELVQPDGSALPAFTPGSHVKVQTPSGALRKYSLCNDPAERHRYVISVKRDDNGQGGSLSLHEQARPGDTLPTSLPDNAFPLVDNAKAYLFIAGGIGITPILSMMRFLATSATGTYRLVYLTRDLSSTAFADVLAEPPFAAATTLHHDEGDPANAFDLWPLLEKPTNAHIYCCGPRALMDAVRDMSGHWPFGAVRFESFGVDAAMRRNDVAFDVHLARSGRVVHVDAKQSILEALRAENVHVRSSCEAGSCGSCRTTLVAGDVDHRDFVLSEDERATQIMVCCSRARSGSLTLDL